MYSIPELFAAWLSLAAAYETGSMPMHPPAEPADFAQVEQATGQTLPEEFRALYLVANGQIEPDDEGSSSQSHQFIAGFWFKSIDEALEIRQQQLEAGGGEFFKPDLFPFWTRSDGTGMAVDLGGDDIGERGDVIHYHSDRAIDYRHAKSLSEYLTHAVENEDSLALHYVSEDPRLAGLRQWYLSRVDTQNRKVEFAMELALAPWLLEDDDPRHARFVENYPMHLAANLDAVEACPGDLRTSKTAMGLGIQLTHDWLLESGRISAQKHEELESIRLNREGARQRLLARGEREQRTGESGCTYSLTWTAEESTHSVKIIAYY